MYEMLKDFIKPELLILIPVLYLFGVALKKSTVEDKKIPWILGCVSVILCLMFIISTSVIKGYQETFMALFTGITQGILCAGASVYVNQLIKQASKNE